MKTRMMIMAAGMGLDGSDVAELKRQTIVAAVTASYLVQPNVVNWSMNSPVVS